MEKTDKATLEQAKIRESFERKRYEEKVQWYAAYIQSGHELQAGDYLSGLNDGKPTPRRGKATKEELFVKIDETKVRMQNFVPVQRIRVKYSDRMIWREKPMIPGIIFVRTSLNHREALFEGPIKPYLKGFVSDKKKHRPQAIPESEMDAFIHLVKSDYLVSIEPPSLRPGQRVMILTGPMKGHVAELEEVSDEISKTEYQTDRHGVMILDAEGNPVPRHTVQLCLRLTDLMGAKFRVSLDEVCLVDADTKSVLVEDQIPRS